MYFLYLDEAGCPGTWIGDEGGAQPALVVVGVMVSVENIAPITREFISLKRRFFPGLFLESSFLDSLTVEIKGADIRSQIRKKGRNAKVQLQFMDELLKLLVRFDVRITSTMWPKTLGAQFNGRSVYAVAVQRAHTAFEESLSAEATGGIVVADSRNDQLNREVSHSVFTQKFKLSGDAYPNIVEAPLFAHSNSHAMLQISDLLATVVLWPIATQAFMAQAPSRLIFKRDRLLWIRFAPSLRKLAGLQGSWKNSIWVSGYKFSKRVFWPLDPED